MLQNFEIRLRASYLMWVVCVPIESVWLCICAHTLQSWFWDSLDYWVRKSRVLFLLYVLKKGVICFLVCLGQLPSIQPLTPTVIEKLENDIWKINIKWIMDNVRAAKEYSRESVYCKIDLSSLFFCVFMNPYKWFGCHLLWSTGSQSTFYLNLPTWQVLFKKHLHNMSSCCFS